MHRGSGGRRAGRLTDRDLTVPFPALAVTFPAGSPLDRSQRIALSIIHDSIEERPIYFASTRGLMSQMGLASWAVRHGLVSKLELRPMDSGGLRDRDVWADRATLNIPWHFYAMAVQLSDVADLHGAPEDTVVSLGADAESFLITAEGGMLGMPSR